MKLRQIVWILIILSLVFGCQKKQEPEKKVDAATSEKQQIVTISSITPFSYVCLPHTGSYENHETVIGSLMEAAAAQGFELVGPMLGIYYNSPTDTPAENLIWEIGFEVPDSMEVADPLVVKKWTFTKVAKAMHTGPYETVAETYPKVFEFIGKMNLMPAGPTMERFLSDPLVVAPEEIETEIWVPVSGGQ